MVVALHNQQSSQNSTAPRPGVKQEVQHLTGVLWYEMLSALNQTGMNGDTLGTGGEDFQSMFLWNLSQNDFGKYDSNLVNAALHQIGGTASEAPTASVSTIAALAAKGAAAPIPDDAAPAFTQSDTPSPDLVTQATNFAKSVWPQITAAAQALGVPTVAVLAQTALETGWGASAPGNNLFGIKASAGESSSTRPTHEMANGELTQQFANFRDYGSVSSSVSDYVSLIQSSYQNAAGQNSVSGFAQALQAGGYATDNDYAAKIEQIAQSPIMAQVLQAVGGATQSSNNGSAQ